MYIISHKCTANIFVWRSGLKTLFHGDYRLKPYIVVVKVSYTQVAIFFVSYGLAWKHFAVYIIRKTGLMVRFKNMVLWRLLAAAIIHVKWKVSFVWYQAAMILKHWYGACLLIYIMSLYILLFTVYTFYSPDQFSHCNSAVSSLTFSLISATSTNDVLTIWGKRIMDRTRWHASIT